MEKEIIEGNFSIAKFCGYDYPSVGNEVFLVSLDLHNYHEDWKKLMPVVEKIGNCRWPDYYGTRGKTEDDDEFDDCVYLRTFGMRDKYGDYMVRFNASNLFIAPTLIEAAWLAVVDFCTWYNNNSK